MVPLPCSPLRVLLACALWLLALPTIRGTEEKALATPEWMAELRPTTGVTVREVGVTSATIEWPAKLGGDGRLRFERMELYLDENHDLARRWDEWLPVKVSRTGDTFTAHISHLTPLQPWWLRALPLDGGATAGGQLFTVRFDTLARAPTFTLVRVAWLALGILVAVVAWRRMRARRS